MAADPSIYSMIRPPAAQPGPLDNYSAMMQLRALGDTSQLSALHRQKLEGDLAEEDAFKSKIADWVKSGGAGQLPLEAYGVSPARAAAFDKNRLEGRKTQGEIDKNEADVKLKKWELGDKVHTANLQDLQGANDQATWDLMRKNVFERYAKEVGIDEAQKRIQAVPAQFSPETKQALLATGLKTKEYLDFMKPDIKEVSDGQRKFWVDVNPNSNPAIKTMKVQLVASPDAQLSASTARRGQDQPVWDEQRGVFVTRPGAPGGGGGAPAAAPAPSVPAAAPVAPGGPAPAAPAPSAPGPVVPPAGPQVIKPSGLPPKNADVAELRKEFNALPEVKAFRDVIPIVEAARTAPNTRSGDIQLGYAVGKILDPNSVVREGEIKMVGDAAPIYEKYKGEFDSVVGGTGRFTPETRKQLVAMLDSAVTQRENAYKQAETTYRGIADRNGIAHDQVIITPQSRTGAAAPGAPKMFDKMPDPAQYSGRRMQADDGTIYQSDGSKWVRQRK